MQKKISKGKTLDPGSHKYPALGSPLLRIVEASRVRGWQTAHVGSARKGLADCKSAGHPKVWDKKTVPSLVRHVLGGSLPGLLVGPVGIVTHECSVNMKSSHPETLNTSANSH